MSIKGLNIDLKYSFREWEVLTRKTQYVMRKENRRNKVLLGNWEVLSVEEIFRWKAYIWVGVSQVKYGGGDEGRSEVMPETAAKGGSWVVEWLRGVFELYGERRRWT